MKALKLFLLFVALAGLTVVGCNNTEPEPQPECIIIPANANPEAPCPTVYDPVCGCNDSTYQNECVAKVQNGVETFTPGECPEQD